MQRRQQRLGASLLLEAVLGLGLFTGALLVVMALIPGGHRALNKGRESILANALAREILDERRSRAYTPAVDETLVLTRGMRIDGQDATTDYTVTIDETDLPTPYDSKDIYVRVEWIEKNMTRSVHLETIVVR